MFLYDRTFKTDHGDIIERCIETILSRQSPMELTIKQLEVM